MVMSEVELADILEKHALWLKKDEHGVQADLSFKDLRGMNLQNARLRKAILNRADLSDANLSHANLCQASLEGTVLLRANLRNARLMRADFSHAVCLHANFSRANMHGANLFCANLDGASLHLANLEKANLTCTQLDCANIALADLTENICRIDIDPYSICIREQYTSIGCQSAKNEIWLETTCERPLIAETNEEAIHWWRIHGEMIKAAIRTVMSKKESKNYGQETQQ